MSIEKFKFWCHKVLPLVYDDSLSYYELLCKVVKKINEVIDSENEVQALIGEADSKLTELEADMTEVKGDVEDITTRLTTAEDELTSLYTRVGTIEGDIVDIQTDVRNLETISVEALTRANAAKTSVEALESMVEGMQEDITDLEAAVAQAGKVYVDARTLEADYEIPAPAKEYEDLRYYFTDDGSSTFNVILSTAFVNYIKKTGRKVELFVGASGSGYVTVNLSSISSLFKTYSIEGRGIQTSISSQYGAQKIVLWWDEDEFDWSMVEAELKDVHDLALDTQMVANGLNTTVNAPTTGLVDRVGALEQAGGGAVFMHDIRMVTANGDMVFVHFFSSSATPLSTVLDLYNKFPLWGYIPVSGRYRDNSIDRAILTMQKIDVSRCEISYVNSSAQVAYAVFASFQSISDIVSQM